MDIKEINVVREEPAPCHIKLNVEVPQGVVRSTVEKVEKEFRNQANIPGFRKGKAPWKLVRKRHAEDIQNEAKQRLLQASLREAVDREQLQVESSPQVDNQDELRVDPDNEFVFAAEFDVAPDFELPNYKGLEVSHAAEEVGEVEVDEYIQQLMSQRTSYEKADKAAEEGDLLKGSYEGRLREDADDEGLSDTAKYLLAADDTWIALREPEILPGVTEKLAGAEADSDYEIEVDFPEDFHEKDLAGKTVDYKIDVDEVHAAQTPEFTDEMAQQLGAEDAADARDKIKMNLNMQRQRQQGEAAREEVVEKLLAKVDFPLPPRILASETYNTMSQIYQERQRQGTTEEQLQEQQDQLRREAEKTAQARLKRRYVLRKIAEEEGIRAESADIQHMVQMLSQYHKMPEKELVERLQQTGGINDLINTIVENKAIERILELADTGEEEAEAGDDTAEAAARAAAEEAETD